MTRIKLQRTNLSKVTVITPVFNNKEDIINAIESIRNQSYVNWEYIIVDDCSRDGTYQLINEYINKLKTNKIKIIRNAKNRGTYISINKAIKASDGIYITILGSDDTFHQDKLKKQVEILDNHPDIMMTDAWYMRRDILVKNNCATMMFRRQAIKEIGYFDSLRFGADSEFKHRLIKYYKKRALKRLQEVLYYAKIRPGSLTRSRVTGRKNVRVGYRDQFIKWHRESNNLFIPYPMKNRPFQVDPVMLP